MSTFSTDSTSALLSQINELLENFARLNSNVELYTQVHLLQQKFNTLEENYNSLQNNIHTLFISSKLFILESLRFDNNYLHIVIDCL